MNVLFVGINSKYIHPSASIISLSKNLRYPNQFIEFTIKDSIEHMTTQITSFTFDLIGISTYIWNVDIVEKLIENLKPFLLSHQKICLGGPEVSYDQTHFINKFQVDFIISGEAEESINELCDYLEGKLDLSKVSNLSYKLDNHIVTNSYRLPNIKKILFGHDLIRDKLKRIVYFESSRGCPYRCSYCVASLEKKVRHFDINYVKSELQILFNQNVSTIKFLDRTFNSNTNYMLELLDFIDHHNRSNTIIQFEIVADLITQPIIERINRMSSKMLRFEIGVQSTNDITTKAVKRIQNFKMLSKNIYMLQQTNKVDLHLDLIAGLPYEDYETFQNTFNNTFSLQPKELQLGFLKMLRGTPLRLESDKFRYRYQQQAPYEIIDNEFITIDELNNIRLVEECIEKYYNSNYFPKSHHYIINNLILDGDFFGFYLDLGMFLNSISFNFSRYQLDELFSSLAKYIYINHQQNYDEMLFLLKQDYLLHYRNRPKIWWSARLPKEVKNQLIENYFTQMPITNLSKDELYRYAHFEKFTNKCFVIVYHPTKFQSFLFEV